MTNAKQKYFQVPVLNASNLGLIKPNTLVRYRGMVQDMLGNEYYIGAFKVLDVD